MIVMVLERVSSGKRGQLTRWLLEPKAGVFVGNVSARVRDRLWQMICKGMEPDNGGILIYSTSDNEQGFSMRIHGNTNRTLIELDGLYLVKIPSK
ncbi:MAG: type I-E CRISPR-associated endoribonuclease Cas2e [Bacillota bacterium]|jgi:CRISPR-associated protein Cas2|nr:type I-E CRISPR-associated endoribonuclease Cas2e [Bacillota bacterium]